MTNQVQPPFDRTLRFLRLRAFVGVVVVGIPLAVLAAISPCGLVLFFFFLWAVLFLCRRTSKFSVIALIACALCLINCLRISVSDPSELFNRLGCQGNLKDIAVAMHNYAQRYGTLPPAYIADPQGKPIHSWRVLLLPFLGGEELYEKYSFDEPWDGPNNRKLHSEIMRVYTCLSDTAARANGAMTSYVVVTGPHTAFPGPQPVKLADFRKPLADALLVIEVANSGIHWMEPRDLPISEMDFKINGTPGKSLSSCHGWSWQYGYGIVVCAVYADGHAEYVPLTLSPDALNALLTIDQDERSE